MHKILTRGFTLIELLVVIAIIGILASVVLISLNSARSKGADAAVKANLDGVRTQAEIVYDAGQTYVGVCSNSNVLAAINNAKSAAGVVAATITAIGTAVPSAASAGCHESSSGWAVSVSLKSAGAWCVDGGGNASSSSQTNSIAASAVVCSY